MNLWYQINGINGIRLNLQNYVKDTSVKKTPATLGYQSPGITTLSLATNAWETQFCRLHSCCSPLGRDPWSLFPVSLALGQIRPNVTDWQKLHHVPESLFHESLRKQESDILSFYLREWSPIPNKSLWWNIPNYTKEIQMLHGHKEWQCPLHCDRDCVLFIHIYQYLTTGIKYTRHLMKTNNKEHEK